MTTPTLAFLHADPGLEGRSPEIALGVAIVPLFSWTMEEKPRERVGCGDSSGIIVPMSNESDLFRPGGDPFHRSSPLQAQSSDSGI